MIKFKIDEIREMVLNTVPLAIKLSEDKDYDSALALSIEYNRIIDFILKYILELEKHIADSENKLTRE